MLGVLALAAVFLAEDAVLGIALGEEPAHRLLRRLVGDRHRIVGAARELVLDVEALAEPRQDRPAGDVGHLVEEGDEFVGMGFGGHHGPPGVCVLRRSCGDRPDKARASKCDLAAPAPDTARISAVFRRNRRCPAPLFRPNVQRCKFMQICMPAMSQRSNDALDICALQYHSEPIAGGQFLDAAWPFWAFPP